VGSVRPSIKEAAVRTVDGSDFTQGEVVEAAFAALFGTKDPLLKAKRQKIQQLAKELKICVTFKYPDRQPDRALAA
jgi:hypothetical protein